MSFLWYPIEHLPIILVTVLVAFTVHEFAHAWTAWRFGDPTAYDQGRVTLNPRAHLDWIGLLFLLIAGFGWAKPVPVRRRYFRRPRLTSILVTAAGPLSNLLLAFFGLLVYYVLVYGGIVDNPATVGDVWTVVWYWVRINLVLLLFNLIPLPPLDGYRIVEEFAPLQWRVRMAQNEQWGIFVFLLIVFLPPLRAVTIDPLFDLLVPIWTGMMELLNALFGVGGGGGGTYTA